jgi:hypothetical protein
MDSPLALRADVNDSSTMTTALSRYDAACHALAGAKDLTEVKDIADKMTALKQYARRAKNRQLEIDAAEPPIGATRFPGPDARAAAVPISCPTARRSAERRACRGAPGARYPPPSRPRPAALLRVARRVRYRSKSRRGPPRSSAAESDPTPTPAVWRQVRSMG